MLETLFFIASHSFRWLLHPGIKLKTLQFKIWILFSIIHYGVE